ncbi:MAG: HAD family phosphatase [Actinobacteria bacterium]|nr:HAD family phosphatase [Actinomycetota bacterium]
MADAVVLDLDGLLIDSESAAFDAASEIFAGEGVTVSPDLFSENVGLSTSHLYTALVSHFGLSVAVEDLLRLREDRLARFYLAPTPMRGAIEFVRRTANYGVVVAVASSSPATVVTSAIDALGLNSQIAVMVGRGGAFVGAPKPAPDVYVSALRQLGVSPEAAVGVEDSATGAVASVAAGLTTVVVPNQWTRRHLFPPGVLSTDSLADLEVRSRSG